jgi:hypothetical protein
LYKADLGSWKTVAINERTDEICRLRE